jgi:MFS family permease
MSFPHTPHPTPRTPFYGWRITWALAVTQTIGYGILTYVFGVFVKPMEAELGWTRTQTSTAFSIAILCAGLAAIPVGRFVDKHGSRLVMTLGSSLAALLVLAWSFVQSLPVFYAVMIGAGLAMSMVLYDVAFTVMAVWFRQQRSRAMLIITLVAGLASTIFIPLATLLNETLGWRDALRVLAIILATTIPLHALILRHKPQDMGLLPDGDITETETTRDVSVRTRAALGLSAFWFLLLSVVLVRFAVSVLTPHLVPLLTERGYSPALVAGAAGSIGLLQLLGRIFFTPFSSRLPLSVISAMTFGIHALGLACLLFIPTTLGVWLFVFFYGASNGAITLARAALLADIFGSANYGQLNGIISFAVAITGAVAPLLAGYLHEQTGSYNTTLFILIVLASISALLVAKANHTSRDTLSYDTQK